METRYITVVFAIDDEDKFKPIWDMLHEKLIAPRTEPWRVSGISLGDEMTRVDLLETAMNEVDDKEEMQRVFENIFSATLDSLEGKVVADFY